MTNLFHKQQKVSAHNYSGTEEIWTLRKSLTAGDVFSCSDLLTSAVKRTQQMHITKVLL